MDYQNRYPISCKTRRTSCADPYNHGQVPRIQEEHDLIQILAALIFLALVVLSPVVVLAEQGNFTEDEKAEAQALRKHASVAKRKGKILTLSLTSGKLVSIRNKDSCKGYEDCEFYLFNGLLPGGQFFIVNQYLWEGSNVYLISVNTGTRYEVYAEPHISPDGKHIATASPSEAYNINGVFLWEIKNGFLIQRFRFEPSNYALYSFSHWNGPNVVELLKYTYAAKDICPKSSDMMELPVRLIAEKGKWWLDETLNKDKVQCR